MGTRILLYLMMLITMSRILHETSVPPLKYRSVFVRLPKLPDHIDMRLHDMELDVLKWELADSEHSRKWGVLLRDMNHTVKKIKLCFELPQVDEAGRYLS
ncbi:hypothetical protein [Vibrio phage vB_pir03]|nr:hypothetical protein [Vibrio phage vB_pir03]